MRAPCANARWTPFARLRVDGETPSTPCALRVGATVEHSDMPDGPLLLMPPRASDRLRRRAAAIVARAEAEPPAPILADVDGVPGDVVLCDARGREIAATLVRSARGWLLAWDGAPPPAGRPLTVLRAPGPARRPEGATICFTPGTIIDTPTGARDVADLLPGDMVFTADDGPQPILWVGARPLSAAHLHARPDLRPIRLRADALAPDAPRPDLLVSPGHRILVEGPRARALWGEPEVLARAVDLLDDARVTRSAAPGGVTYLHLLLPSHAVVWANGLRCESFRPGEADLSPLGEAEREELRAVAPDPAALLPARRMLAPGEAALLSHAPPRHLS